MSERTIYKILLMKFKHHWNLGEATFVLFMCGPKLVLNPTENLGNILNCRHVTRYVLCFQYLWCTAGHSMAH